MNLLQRYRNLLAAIGIFCCGLFLFSIGLSQQEIVGFESRFYLFALEMWRHGLSWFPMTYGSSYPDYPVMSTLMIYAAAKLTGHLDKFSAVLPSAIAAAVTLAVTYLIGALHKPRWGLFAVFFMLLTNMFVMEARTISLDQYVAMVTALAFYLVYSGELSRCYKRLWFIPLLFAVGFAFRGPIGLVIPAGVVCIFYLLDKNFKKFFAAGFAALLTLVICSAVLLGIAYHVGGMSFVYDVIRMQVSGRLQDAVLPWYFYLYESIGAYALSYPLAILIGLGLLTHRKNVEQKFLMKLIGWALVILIGLSIPSGKKIRYVLAFAPALALLSAYLFAFTPQQKYFRVLKKLLFIFLFFIPAFCFVAVWRLEYIAALKNLQFAIPYLYLLIGLGILQIVSLILRKSEIAVVGLTTLTMMFVYIMAVEPVNLALNNTRDFVVKLEQLRHLNHQALAFYRENPDGMPIKYVLNMPVEEQPVFITSQEGLEQFHTPAIIVIDPDHFSQLPPALAAQFKVIDTGQVGHDVEQVIIRIPTGQQPSQ